MLTSILNPKNVTSMQTIELGTSDSNVYIQTLKKLENPYDQAARKKKITIIKRRRNKDGSVVSSKQNIFKDYEDNYPQREAVRLKSALQCYRSSVRLIDGGKALDERAREMMQLMPDGTLVMKGGRSRTPVRDRNASKQQASGNYSEQSVQRKHSQDIAALKPGQGGRSREYPSKHTSKNSKAVTNQSFKTEKGDIDENFEFEPKANPSQMYTSMNQESAKASHNQYNQRKKKQEAQENAVGVMTLQQKQALKNQKY